MTPLEFLLYVFFVSLSKSKIQWNEKLICIKQCSKFKVFYTDGKEGFCEQRI